MHLHRDCGFSLIELVATLAVIAIIAGVGMPMVLSTLQISQASAAARSVQSELQRARLKAVAANQPMRVRFDCPSAGRFRMVELIGTPAIPDARDNSADRCSESSYPYRPYTSNPLARPRNDGPLRMLRNGAVFTQSQTIEFWPDGSAHTDAGTGGGPWPPIGLTGVTISLKYKTTTKSITVNGLGKVQLQ